MIKTIVTWKEFKVEDFLEKIGMNDDDVIRIEELFVRVSESVRGDEFKTVCLKLLRVIPKGENNES